MSTPKPNHIAPPIPHTLELDAHMRQFFEPTEWSGPVDARFKLADPALQGMVFIGRIAELCSGAPHLVMQLVTGEPANDGRGPCLMSALAVDLDGAWLGERREETQWYFSRHLKYPGIVNARDWRGRVPTLSGYTANSGLRRLHFDAGTGIGLALAPQGAALLDLRDEGQMNRGEWPYIELGDALFDFEPQTQPLRAFVELEDALLHQRVGTMLRSSDEVLGSEVRFFAMNGEERSQYVFDCDEATVKRTFEMLRLVLTVELGTNGALDGWVEATWHPWTEDRIIGGNDAQGRGVGVDVLPPLRNWLGAIEEKLGCRVQDEIRLDAEGLHTFARDWAGSFRVTVETPSAHELVEAGVQLKEMLT